jgi:hypothetical protein
MLPLLEMQGDLLRLWLGTATTLAQSTANLYTTLGRQALEAWSPPRTLGGATWPWATAWPVATFPMPMAAAAHPFSFMMPTASFMMPTAVPSWTPWTAPALGPAAMTPWLWPMTLAPQLMMPFAGYGARSPAGDLVDSAATAYRTASGYAVATVLAPLTAAFDAGRPQRAEGLSGWRTTH